MTREEHTDAIHRDYSTYGLALGFVVALASFPAVGDPFVTAALLVIGPALGLAAGRELNTPLTD